MHKLAKFGFFQKYKSQCRLVESFDKDELLSRNIFYMANMPDYPQDDIAGMIRRAVDAAKGREIEIINFERDTWRRDPRWDQLYSNGSFGE